MKSVSLFKVEGEEKYYRFTNCVNFDFIGMLLKDELFTHNINADENCPRCASFNLCSEYITRIRRRIFDLTFGEEQVAVIENRPLFKIPADEISAVLLQDCRVRMFDDDPKVVRVRERKQRKVDPKYAECEEVIVIQ